MKLCLTFNCNGSETNDEIGDDEYHAACVRYTILDGIIGFELFLLFCVVMPSTIFIVIDSK